MTPDFAQRQAAAIERWLRLFHPLPATAISVQALIGPRKALSLCTTDLSAAARQAYDWDRNRVGFGIYWTLNPVRPECTGSYFPVNEDIVRRLWLPIDIEAARPPGTSSTDAQLAAAWPVVDRCYALLSAAGLVNPIVARSGNGWHQCWPIDLPNDDEARELIRAILDGLAARCADKLSKAEKELIGERKDLDPIRVTIGVECHDAKRIWACYGTLKRKGTDTPDRPHRWTSVVETGDFAPQSWASDADARNVQALRQLLVSWQKADDLRRGRPEPPGATPIAERARAYVAKMPPAISGSGGHTTTYEVAQVLARGFALPREQSWPILCEYNARCQPPWSEKELLHKIETAERDSRLPSGYLLGLALYGNGHATGRANGAATKTIRVPAEAVEPLPAAPLSRVEPFPLSVFPPSLERFVREGAESLTCPPDYFALPMLCAASAAIGASRALRLTGDWWVMPSLYACVVAPPGSAKSPAASRSLSPVKYQQLANHVEYKERRRIWEQTESALRGDPPSYCRTYATDITTEKLASLLRDCPRGLLLHRDELIAWIASFNQYRDGGKGADQQVFMMIWDHQGFSIERKGHDDGLPVTVQRPCLSVFGTIQPDVLTQLTGGAGQDGFLERILFSYPEASTEPRRWTWQGISAEARGHWREDVGRLYSLVLVDHLEAGDAPWTRFVTFSDDARSAWESWYASHQKLKDDLPESMWAFHAKLESYCARLALLVEMLWFAAGDGFDPLGVPEVSPGAVECGAALTRYFLSHARRAYGCLELTPSDRRIDRVVSWLRQQGAGATPRDLIQYRVGGVRRTSDAIKLIEDLTDRCLGKVVTERADNGREVVRFYLHGAGQTLASGPNSADSADKAPTGKISAISGATQGLTYSADSADAPPGVNGNGSHPH